MQSQLMTQGGTAEPGLSARLREGTAAAHRSAEGGVFMQALLHGEVELARYGEYLRSLRPVYGALEAGLVSGAADPRLAPLVRPEVFRVAALDADLAHFRIPARAPRPEARRYVARLEWLTAQAPHLLVAHAYTRTLGDLSGGQLVRRVVQERFGLTGLDGLWFYEFPIPQLGAYKREYREMLDALPLSPVECEQVVAEARVAFELNMALTDELT